MVIDIVSNFNFEQDLLKHYVRKHGWLPLCQERLRQVKETGARRRIRYFTFCAIGAVDVLMLDIAKIVTCSDSGRFDNVVFFDRTNEGVASTQKAIPGAIGFPGDFLNTVLLDDDEEDDVVDDHSPLKSVVDQEDSSTTRTGQRTKAIRQEYIRRFPFDILNFDLEGFFFTPNDPIPGKMVRALSKIFEWQKRQGKDGQGKTISVNSFSLMFTTQVGPPNLTEDYLHQLEECLQGNINANSTLRTAFISRVGHENVSRLRSEEYDLFFKLGMPKVLASILKETDWVVDAEKGMTIYEFSRSSSSGPYQMLHMIMQVKRQNPPSDRRMPGTVITEVNEAFSKVIEKLFQEKPVVVTEQLIESVKGDLQAHLDIITARRKKYLSAEY